MRQGNYHPNAYLERIKNVVGGLEARTRLLNALDDRGMLTVKELAELTVMSPSVSRYHLRLLEAERIVKRRGKRPYTWRITGKGQKRLIQANE
ncbi:MAG: ArsR family transcriptional regulator [Candidatus Methanospirareceae archaeon]